MHFLLSLIVEAMGPASTWPYCAKCKYYFSSEGSGEMMERRGAGREFLPLQENPMINIRPRAVCGQPLPFVSCHVVDGILPLVLLDCINSMLTESGYRERDREGEKRNLLLPIVSKCLEG